MNEKEKLISKLQQFENSNSVYCSGCKVELLFASEVDRSPDNYTSEGSGESALTHTEKEIDSVSVQSVANVTVANNLPIRKSLLTNKEEKHLDGL